jgi:hypothetical protein
MGRLVVLADVGLDLHDPANPPARFVLANEPRAKQRFSCGERRAGENDPIDDSRWRQRNG